MNSRDDEHFRYRKLCGPLKVAAKILTLYMEKKIQIQTQKPIRIIINSLSLLFRYEWER